MQNALKFRKQHITLLYILSFSMLMLSSVAILANSIAIPSMSTPTKFAMLSAPKSVHNFLNKHIVLPEQPFTHEMARRTFLHRTANEISELLATRGYFSPIITFDQQTQKKIEIPEIIVDPGPLSLVESAQIEFQGRILTDESFQNKINKWRTTWPLKPGEPFRSAEWEEAKAALLSQVTYEKYAAARIVESEATVDKENARVTLHILIDSGPIFSFGELKITGLERYNDKMIENYKPFHAGEPYRKDKLQQFQIALQNIPHFGNVSVNIDPADIVQHKAIPVHVTITETQSQSIALGGGYSSNNGARAELNYSNHNFLKHAWNFNTLLRLEQKRQTFFTGVNTLPDENNIHYALGASLQRTDIEDLVTIRQRVDAARIYQTNNMQRQYSLNWQREEKRPEGAANQTVEALAFDWRYRYHQVDDPVNIRRGNVTEFKIGGGLDAIFSDQDFLRLYGRQQNWWPVGKRDVFYFRGEAGYTFSPSRFGIPQEYLFRAGGIRSIRGYDFLSIGVREGDAIVGGRAMATGTAEYTHWFMQNWGAAAFVDAGSAADKIENMDIFLGYGAGVRWRSPAGPLAVDLARGHKTGTLRVHFSMVVSF